MPVPTDEEVAKFVTENGPYRLGCRGGCFRDDFDGVRELPSDWQEIEEVQSLKDALSTYDDDGDPEPPSGYSISDWETHIGLCPKCQ